MCNLCVLVAKPTAPPVFVDEADSLNVANNNHTAESRRNLRVFACVKCSTLLSNYDELVSTNFMGLLGKAYLFNRVINLCYDDVKETWMKTGVFQYERCKKPVKFQKKKNQINRF
jgi:hypothetical protein